MPRNYGMRLFGPRPAEGRLPASFPSCRSTQVIYSASCVVRGARRRSTQAHTTPRGLHARK